jgi:hypothetical protein
MFFGPTCLFCGYHPCSVDADICPRCGHADPNPGLRSRIHRVICSLIGVLNIAILGMVFTGMAAMAHPYAGLAVAGCFLLWAVAHVARAVWYAVDPTLSILPRPRAAH